MNYFSILLYIIVDLFVQKEKERDNMTKKYIIENKVFKEVFETCENIYMSLSVIKEFCEKNRDIYELRAISPIIKFIYEHADNLFLYFINKKHAEKNEKITFRM